MIANYSWWRLALDVIVTACLTTTLVPGLSYNYLRIPILWKFYHLGRLDRSIVMMSRMQPGWYVLYTFLKLILMMYLYCHFAGSLYFWIDSLLIDSNFYGDLTPSSKM